MTTPCFRCNRPMSGERCGACGRDPIWCRCIEAAPAAHRPLWLERASQRKNGLARDESGALVA